MENKWISVKERLPEADEFVLCARTQTSMGGTKYITPGIGKLGQGNKFSCEFDWVNVTHWMPLPEPPQNEPD